MPELPEVETTARGLRARLVGVRVAGVGGVDWPRMLPNTTADELDRALAGRAVRAVDRRGKYLLLHLDEALTLAIHRKMSGNLLLVPRAEPPALHTHLVLRLEDPVPGSDQAPLDLRLVDARKFGRVYLLRSPAELEAFLAERLGPEPLGDQLTVPRLERALARRQVPIKAALLDQSVVAGVGNLYADEALWEARIHPLQPANTLGRPRLARLIAAVRRVLERAIERRGTSFSDYVDADGAEGENQGYLNVYGRAGQPCPRCGRPVARLRLGQRSSHYCPHCQRLAGARAAAGRARRPAASRSATPSGRGRPPPGAGRPGATARGRRAAGARG
jgi:formamidopyrimidine-DNA glycosylase